MANPTDRQDPYTQYNFEIHIGGEPVAGFSKVAGITMQLDTVEYKEGGVNDHVHTLPGTMAHADLVLKRGMTADKTFWNWIQDVMSGKIKRKDVTVKMSEGHQGQSLWGWQFTGAYPTMWKGPDLVGDNNKMTIESVELAYSGFSKIADMPP